MKRVKSIIFLVFIFLLFFSFTFFLLEPNVLKSATSTQNVTLNQTVVEEISLSCDSSVTGLTSINGITGGTSNGTFSCNAITSNSTGYNMTLKKNALLCHSTLGCGTDKQFDDYSTTTDPLDYNFAEPGAGQEWWAFNVSSSSYPTAVTQRFKDNGTACNTGTNVTDGKCWTRIPTTPTTETVVNRSSATDSNGDTTYFGIRIQAGSSNALNSGTYTSTITVTVATN
ncbi:MAG: hypothetical protein ACPLZH_01395 [Minisyncoccales bacterium]